MPNQPSSNDHQGSADFKLSAAAATSVNSSALKTFSPSTLQNPKKRKSSSNSKKNNHQSERDIKTAFTCCSFRFILAVFFTVLLLAATVPPFLVLLRSADVSVQQQLTLLVNETALNVGQQIEREMRRVARQGKALLNLSKQYRSQNYSTIHFSYGQFMKLYDFKSFSHVWQCIESAVTSTRCNQANFRRMPVTGALNLIYRISPELIQYQFCSVTNGIWNFTLSDNNESQPAEEFRNCTVFHINTTSKKLIPTNETISLGSKTYLGVPGSSPLDYSPGTIPFQNVFNENFNNGQYNPLDAILYTNPMLDLGGSRLLIPFFAADYLPSSTELVDRTFGLMNQAVSTFNLQKILRNIFLQSVGEKESEFDQIGARGFLLNHYKHVVGSSHTDDQIYYLIYENPPQNDPRYTNAELCKRNGNDTITACLYNLSTHEPYRLLAQIGARRVIDEIQNGGASLLRDTTRSSSINAPSMKYGTNEREDFFWTATTVFFAVGAIPQYLFTFIPQSYYTAPIQAAERTVTIIIAVLIVGGAVACFFWLSLIFTKVSVLSAMLAKNPFDPELNMRRNSNSNSSASDEDSVHKTPPDPTATPKKKKKKKAIQRKASPNGKSLLEDRKESPFSVFFFPLEEISILEEAYLEFRQVIDQLRSFMPQRIIGGGGRHLMHSSSGSTPVDEEEEEESTTNSDEKNNSNSDHNNSNSIEKNNSNSNINISLRLAGAEQSQSIEMTADSDGSIRTKSNNNPSTIVVTNNAIVTSAALNDDANNNNNSNNNASNSTRKSPIAKSSKISFENDDDDDKNGADNKYEKSDLDPESSDRSAQEKQSKPLTSGKAVRFLDDIDGGVTVKPTKFSHANKEGRPNLRSRPQNSNNNNNNSSNTREEPQFNFDSPLHQEHDEDDICEAMSMMIPEEKQKEYLVACIRVKGLVRQEDCGSSSSSNALNAPNQRQEQEESRLLIENIKLVVKTIDEKVLVPTGASLIEYRTDFFLVALRISHRNNVSRLATRFVENIQDASEIISEKILASTKRRPLPSCYPKVCVFVGLAVGPLRLLKMNAAPAQSVPVPNERSLRETSKNLVADVKKMGEDRSTTTTLLLRALAFIGPAISQAIESEKYIRNFIELMQLSTTNHPPKQHVRATHMSSSTPARNSQSSSRNHPQQQTNNHNIKNNINNTSPPLPLVQPDAQVVSTMANAIGADLSTTKGSTTISNNNTGRRNIRKYYGVSSRFIALGDEVRHRFAETGYTLQSLEDLPHAIGCDATITLARIGNILSYTLPALGSKVRLNGSDFTSDTLRPFDESVVDEPVAKMKSADDVNALHEYLLPPQVRVIGSKFFYPRLRKDDNSTEKSVEALVFLTNEMDKRILASLHPALQQIAPPCDQSSSSKGKKSPAALQSGNTNGVAGNLQSMLVAPAKGGANNHRVPIAPVSDEASVINLLLAAQNDVIQMDAFELGE